jgi:hypothetical protein
VTSHLCVSNEIKIYPKILDGCAAREQGIAASLVHPAAS